MGQLEGIETEFTNKGYEQIRKISKSLKENKIEIIYCSDFKRAYETAIIANEELNLPIFPCKEIRGLNMGKYQGLLFNDFISKKEVQDCFNNYNLKIGQGESINQLNKRILYFLKNMLNNTRQTKIAIITHSAVISNLKAYLSKEQYISLCECSLLYKNNRLSVINYKCNNK